MKSQKGQMMMEFIFSMMVIFFMVYSTVQIFRWIGLDLAERRKAHDDKLLIGVAEDKSGPLSQIDPIFYDPLPLDATAPVDAP